MLFKSTDTLLRTFTGQGPPGLEQTKHSGTPDHNLLLKSSKTLSSIPNKTHMTTERSALMPPEAWVSSSSNKRSFGELVMTQQLYSTRSSIITEFFKTTWQIVIVGFIGWSLYVMHWISWWKLPSHRWQGTICQAIPKAEEACHENAIPIFQANLTAIPKSHVVGGSGGNFIFSNKKTSRYLIHI